MVKAGVSLLLLALASLACIFGTGDQDPQQATATSLPNQVVSYRVPLYSTSLKQGESVPGTQLTYLGREGSIYNVTIGGLPAAKRVGDSFAWKGVMVPGVVGDYNLRISPTLLGDNLQAAGSVQIFVLNPIPVELAEDFSVMNSLLEFNNIGVDHIVSKGGSIPGTTLIYEGQSDQGARFSGTSGYPYRLAGDSLVWTGRLRGNVIVRQSLRVTSIQEDSLRLVGTVQLWITSS